ncbi:MAG: argininosuccinate synthase [Anaerolineaceae bacterium]|nr:argininosuccinate synthase [Anaerolineaceae bacterium]
MSDTQINKVVLAYSGGLDTSVIIHWLKENYDCEVIAVTADVGQGMVELDHLEERALQSGASKLVVFDLKEEFAKDYIFPMIRSGAIYERKYLLGTAIARPLIAKYLVKVAEAEGADAIAHGCTGKGNDQVRFELTFTALNPRLKTIAPWREWQIKSREDALAYLDEHGIEFPTSNPSLYSRDRNLWHLSHEGADLEDPDSAAKDDLYLMTTAVEQAPDKAEIIEIEFSQGNPIALNGKKLSPAKLIEALNEIGGKHGIGICDMVENRLVGMKSRGVYETPGGTILVKAHSELESITIDRDTMHYKDLLALKYAELLYFGQWFTPVRKALDAFFKETQKPVNGVVRLKLYKGNVIVQGRKSDTSLYHPEFATFGEDEVYNQSDAAGFIRLFGLPMKVRALLGADDIQPLSPDEIIRD